MERRQRKTRDESREETKQRLLEAAEEVFAERGLFGASLEDVAERAGYTRGALYWHFKDKRELFAAVVKQRSEQRLDLIAGVAGESPSAPDLIQRLRAVDKAAERSPAWHVLALEEVLSALRDPEVAEDVRAHEHRINKAMGNVAQGAFAAAGAHAPLPAAQLGVVIHALDLGLRVQRALDPRAVPASLLYDVLELLFTAAAPRDDGSG